MCPSVRKVLAALLTAGALLGAPGLAGAAAPVDSTRLTSGRRFTAAMRAARRIFSTVYGLTAPPSTVGSLAITTRCSASNMASP